ncbi:SRPBCC family protein [Edaphobacter bradus]|uniref:SRPBCC family protein n=1 Tax=Edaphobacter bradus TaxID=2259016 RepID=UPI0021DF9A63|nr:SRPBCC family protein [Edaphobacter bradus]
MSETVVSTVVRKSVRVPISVGCAFSVFVEQMETWWPPEHHIGEAAFEAIFVEPKVGGRWYERDGNGKECDWGKVMAWDPPRLVTFSWHLGPSWKFDPDMAKASEVAIRFTPETEGTLVELEHSHLERHGEGWEQLKKMLESADAWEQTLREFAKRAELESEL